MATASRSHGAGDASEICECVELGGGVFSWLHDPGTKMKLGREGHQPDYGARKISPLPHFLQTLVRSREEGKGWVKALRPLWGSLRTNALKRKVAGPLVVSRVRVWNESVCGYGVLSSEPL